MNSLTRILVAVDGSEFADKAFNAAAGLAKQFGAKLLVMHVVQMPPMLSVDKTTVNALQTQLEKEAERVLLKCKSEAQSKFGIDIETIKLRGRPAEMIVDTAKARDIELIVVGSRGLSGFKGMFLGSVSSDVTRSAKQPVLVVR